MVSHPSGGVVGLRRRRRAGTMRFYPGKGFAMSTVRRLVLLLAVVLLAVSAPSSAEAASKSVSTKTLSSFSDPFVAATAGIHLANLLLEQAWRGKKVSSATRMKGVKLALSALESSEIVVRKALASGKFQGAARARLVELKGIIATAQQAAKTIPAKPTGVQVRKGAKPVTVATLRADGLVSAQISQGLAKVRAATLDALVGEDGIVALVGEDGSQPLIGEDGLLGARALVGEDGLVAKVLAKAPSTTKLNGPKQKLSTAKGALATALSKGKGPSLTAALRQTALANRSIIGGLTTM